MNNLTDFTKFDEAVASCPSFHCKEWIDFSLLAILLENDTKQCLFTKEFTASVKNCDEIFIVKNQKNEEANRFAQGNVDCAEELLKTYEGEDVEELRVLLTECSFYKFTLPEKKEHSKLNFEAKPFTPTSPTLNAAASSWTPNAEAKPFVFSTDAPEWTPQTSLSVEATEFKPSFSVDAPEFIPSYSSKPACMPSASGITEGTADDFNSDYDNFFDDSTGCSVSFSTIVAPPPVEEKPKVYICDLEERKYSVDWLLQVRLEKKFINPAPEIPADVAHPLYRRTEIWTEKQFNPYKFEANEEDFGFENLGKFVTPVFQDEINYDEVCDPFSGMYGVDTLKRMQPCYRDIHPALIDKPEILNKDTINNIIMQFMAVGGMNPLFQAQLGGGMVPGGFPGILPPNLEIPPHILQMLPPSMAQNFMAIKAMIQCGAGKSSWLDDDPNAESPQEEESSSDGENVKEEPLKKEKTPPPEPKSPKKKKGSPRSKSKPTKVSSPRFSKGGMADKKTEKKAQMKLLKTKNAWSRRGVVEEEEDLAARTMQSILNKLVPEKFERLLKQALDTKQLVVTKLSTLISLTERLHKKAISEADYAPLYTHFVHKLKKADFKSFETNGVGVDIETVLMELCLKRLNAGFKDEGEDEEEREMKQNKFWKQTLGNYTLLGELYKRGVCEHEKLASIVHTLVGIVTNTDEEHNDREKRVEQLLHVLKSCGTEFEEECKERNNYCADEPHVLEKHFIEISKAAEDETLSLRVRFMLQDLVELKNKHWESRNKGQMCPKFLSEIREDIRKEQLSKKQYLYKLRRQAPAKDRWSKRRSQTPRASSSRSSKRRGNHTPRDSPRQRRCLKSLSDSNVLSAAKKDKKKDSVTPIEKSKRSPKIDKIAWANIVQGHIEKNNANSPPLAKSVPVRKAPAVANAWAKGPPTSLASPPVTPVIPEDAWAKGPPTIPESSPKSLDIDETKEEVTNISSDPSDTLSQPSESSANESELDDLFIESKLLVYFENTEDDNSSLAFFKDILDSGVTAEQLIVTSLNLTIEKKDKHRAMLGNMFVQLLKQEVFLTSEIISGFQKASTFFEDWMIDVPRLPEFVSTWLNQLFEEDLCKAPDFSFLSDRFLKPSLLETRI